MSFILQPGTSNFRNTTDAPQPSFLVSVLHADDVDELVERVRGDHLAFAQIDKGPFAAEVVQTELAGVLLSAAQYGRSLVHTGGPPSGKVSFAVGMSRLPARWQDMTWDLVAIPHGDRAANWTVTKCERARVTKAGVG